jgi:hydrogenase maturation protease
MSLPSISSPTEHDILPVLVLGIGNILLRDEGVGVRVVEAMRDVPLPVDTELVDGGTAGADLVDLLADRRKVIVIDALDAEVEPGAVFRLGPDELLPRDGEMISLHQLGLVESLAMARQLRCVPEEVVIFGVQPRQISPGLELSAEVQDAVPKVIEAVLLELQNGEPNPSRHDSRC